ncbi:helix-turn-helix transcriptional regulator [Salisediminibacterium halotolerans]|uniref:CBS domain-containing protein n=1 Tax=Salisediminibacterium halotolerans TaxID=517425 RepID=A0A1H9S721_9BACI|nr:helix-turn-helix transcriptional regulator [Salisediminibacterium haloalkalitolerans]SER80787.1 CBS domain-containing protein [Salisediminibacterium haloalkalitolerans]
MELNERQEKIIEIVKSEGPITGEKIADHLSLTRATLRPDLAILTMSGFLDAKPRVGYFYTGDRSGKAEADRLKKMRVKDYQSLPVVVKEVSTVYDAIVTMFLEDVGTIFVVNDKDELSGILSRKDLLRASMGKQELENIPVSIIMTRMPNVAVCFEEDTLLEAANQLIHKQIDGLPVVEKRVENDETFYGVIGRISKTTITEAFVSLVNGDDETGSQL